MWPLSGSNKNAQSNTIIVMTDEYYISMGVDSSNRILWYAKDQVDTYLHNGEYKDKPAFNPVCTHQIRKAMVLSKRMARDLVTRTAAPWLAYSKFYIDSKVEESVQSRRVLSKNAFSWSREKIKFRHENKRS